jgi:hypothetical protein
MMDTFERGCIIQISTDPLRGSFEAPPRAPSIWDTTTSTYVSRCRSLLRGSWNCHTAAAVCHIIEVFEVVITTAQHYYPSSCFHTASH